MQNCSPDTLLKRVMLRMPGQNYATTFLCREFSAEDDVPSTFYNNYICTIPFNNSSGGILFSISESQKWQIEEPAPARGEHPLPQTHAFERGEYLQSVWRIKMALRPGEKTVLARKIEAWTSTSPTMLFARLCRAYPDALVYSFPDGDFTWVGATPELLFSVKKGVFNTMALAGTRPATKPGDTAPLWDEKNREEQSIVTDTLRSKLLRLGWPVAITGPFTLNAGPVEHLCTRLQASIPQEYPFNAHWMAEYLSPTPAVLGRPEEKALELINKHEGYNRRFYSGNLLIKSNLGVLETYVMLRCACLAPDGHVTLYAGGGITPLSDPQQEWQETEIKASTLLRHMDK